MGTTLGRCKACGGFVTNGRRQCPNCGAAGGRSLRLRALAGALGGGAVAFTLMACYGAAPPHPACPDGTSDCMKPPPPAPSDSVAPATPLAGDAGK